MEKVTNGPTWARWDLHIHTPNTHKNDQYLGKNDYEKWETLYEDIIKYIGNGEQPEKNIVGIGITDYLSR